ncbi:MAG: hypothetical protein II836_11285, partial [Clostridia bacterium]|nr:hypothetical protein [Clostridia bacterium]
MAAMSLFFKANRPFLNDHDPRGRAVQTNITFYYTILYHTAGLKIKGFRGNWRTNAEFSRRRAHFHGADTGKRRTGTTFPAVGGPGS